MPLTIELPDQLGYRLKSMPNINDYIIKVLAKSLEIPVPKAQESYLWAALICGVAVWISWQWVGRSGDAK